MEGKLKLKQILDNLDKIKIFHCPEQITGIESLNKFINEQGFYIKRTTLNYHNKHLYRLKVYNNIYSRGNKGVINTTYCKQFIEDSLKISICFHIGRKSFEDSINKKFLCYNCKSNFNLEGTPLHEKKLP